VGDRVVQRELQDAKPKRSKKRLSVSKLRFESGKIDLLLLLPLPSNSTVKVNCGEGTGAFRCGYHLARAEIREVTIDCSFHVVDKLTS
jgi:hypothetical protein